VSLADSLVDGYDVIDLLDRLAVYSVDLLAAEAAGLMLADDRGQLRAVASSDESADVMELLQLQAGEGPCLDCFHTATPVNVPELTESAKLWPRFVAAVAEHGAYASIHSVPLRLRGEAVGVLSLLRRTPGALPDEDLALAQALADIATIAILAERSVRRHVVLTEQLQTALNSRVSIEQAKGVLAQHAGLSMDDAFELLLGYARARNLPLAQVAQLIARRVLDPTVITSYATGSRARRRT
jgi:GAF domain-containing protein